MAPLVIVADAHLTRDDPEVGVFADFLREIGPSASALGILGDLFNLWLGARKFALPHHREILAALDDLRRRGIRLFYVEGNRDFHLRRHHLGRPFDSISEGSHAEVFGDRRIWATHGDDINLRDRQYRAWKAFSKSALVWGAFSVLPGPLGTKLGESLERRLSGTNLRHKRRFPIEQLERYAAGVFEKGFDTIVMGHFHEEHDLPMGEREGRPLGAWVLPAFRHSHRFLVFEEGRTPRFETFRR